MIFRGFQVFGLLIVLVFFGLAPVYFSDEANINRLYGSVSHDASTPRENSFLKAAEQYFEENNFSLSKRLEADGEVSASIRDEDSFVYCNGDRVDNEPIVICSEVYRPLIPILSKPTSDLFDRVESELKSHLSIHGFKRIERERWNSDTIH